MQTAPIAVAGVPGAVTVDVNAWTGKRRLFINGAEVPTKRGRFDFPGPNGTPIQGVIKPMKFWETYPKVEVNGVAYATGQEAPTGLKVLALLPAVLFAGGAIGVLCGFAAILVNFVVLRSGASKGAVAAACVGTLVIGALVLLVVAGAIGLAFGTS